jgi:hypothetical protein
MGSAAVLEALQNIEPWVQSLELSKRNLTVGLLTKDLSMMLISFCIDR